MGGERLSLSRGKQRSRKRSLSSSRSQSKLGRRNKRSRSRSRSGSLRRRRSGSRSRRNRSDEGRNLRDRDDVVGKENRSGKRSRSRSKSPRNISELREQRERRRAEARQKLGIAIEKISNEINDKRIKKKTGFDVLPDPAKPPAAITKVLQDAALTSQNTGIAASSVLNPNVVAPKYAKSVYVGGIDAGHTSEKELFDFFNKIINDSTGKNLNAVVSVYVNKMKCFAFVEVNDYNLATAIIQNMNGILYNGSALSLRRPTNYDTARAPPQGKLPLMDVTRVGLKAGRPSTFVENTPDKIYIAGIPFSVTDDQLQELLEAFGPLEAMCIVRDRGYAFCAYKDTTMTDAAISGLNGLALGTNILQVRRADVHAKAPVAPNLNLSDPSIVSQMLPDAVTLPAQAAPPLPQHLITANSHHAAVQNFLISNVPGSSSGLVDQRALGPSIPTKVLVLKNMLIEEELKDDAEYKDILFDIRNECSKFGRVLNVEIPRPNASFHVPGLGKVFVEFRDEVDALTARNGLEGRTFGNRQVVCEYMSPDKFAAKQYQ